MGEQGEGERKLGGRGKTGLETVSPAVDSGDPSSSYSNEPRPNGKRVNLGFYGNTPWATSASLGNFGFQLIVR